MKPLWSLVGAIASLAVLGAGALPATGQELPAEMGLLPPKRPATVPTAPSEMARNKDRIPDELFTLTAAPPLPSSFQPHRPPAPVSQPAPPKPQVAAATAPVRPAAKPVPERPVPEKPVRATILPPPGIGSPPGPKPAAGAPPSPSVRPEPLTDEEIVDRANAFFNNLGTLVADFVQIGGDGRRLGGTLYLQRPGKVRFEYDPPATLEVIADGSSVAVRDRKLATQDLYSISQTPLKFLLRERVNLGQDIRVTGVADDGDAVRLSFEDKSTFGGTSRITLFFDPQLANLTQWRITDPQGFQTIVMLNKVERGRRVDPNLFAINYERMLNNNR